MPQRPKVPASNLYHGVRLQHAVSLPVLGLPVEFASNSRAAMEAVEQSFGIWRSLAPYAPVMAGGPVRVSVIEHEGQEGRDRPIRMTWRMPDDHRVIGFTAGSAGLADFERREVFIYATAELLADRPHFCYSVLEAFTLTALGQADRSPIHAGGIVRGDSVLLLTGMSGSGKSTLVYTAMRSGLQVLSDDAVYVQLRPTLNIWGVPSRICLLPESRALFSELASLEPLVLSNGKTKILVSVPHDRVARVPMPAHRVAVVLLRPSSERVAGEAVGPEPIRESLAAQLRVSFAMTGSSHKVIDLLARRGGWSLGLSRDPAEAVPVLHQIFDHLDRLAPVASTARGS